MTNDELERLDMWKVFVDIYDKLLRISSQQHEFKTRVAELESRVSELENESDRKSRSDD